MWHTRIAFAGVRSDISWGLISCSHMHCRSARFLQQFVHKGRAAVSPIVQRVDAMVKTLGSAQTQVLSCDGKGLSPLCLKVPKARRSGDVSLDSHRELERDALIRIIDRLTKMPHLVLACDGYLQRQVMSPPSKIADSLGSAWNSDAVSIGKIPKEWMATFLLNRMQGAATGFSRETISAIESADSEGIQLLFAFEVQVALTTALPKNIAEDADLAARVFHARADQCGARLQRMWKSGGVAANGTLKWSSNVGGCYALSFTGTAVNEIHHLAIGMKVVPPSHRPITSDFVLKNNHLDHGALVEYQCVVHKLHTFFPAEQGPNHKRIDDRKAQVLKRLGDEQARVLEDEARARSAREVHHDADLLADAQKGRKQLNLEKARAKLRVASEARAKRRMVILSLGGTPASSAASDSKKAKTSE